MMPFFNRIGLESVEVVGPDLDCSWDGLQALALLSSAKTRNKKGPAGASPLAAPMPKSVSFREKI